MDLQRDNKRIPVTGSTSGIGEAIVRCFGREVAAVVVQGRRSDVAERIAAEIRRDGGKATIALGDLSPDEEAAPVVETALTQLGGIDILVNNAASGEPQYDMETAPSKWLYIYNSSLLSMGGVR